MALSAFDDKAAEPKAREVAKVLGKTSGLWDGLRAWAAGEYKPLTETWRFGGKQWGWTLQLAQKKRTLLWLTPRGGYFSAGFALGEKAAQAARAVHLSTATLELIDRAPKYAEGRAVRIDVKSKRAVSTVQKLVAIKMAN